MGQHQMLRYFNIEGSDNTDNCEVVKLTNSKY